MPLGFILIGRGGGNLVAHLRGILKVIRDFKTVCNNVISIIATAIHHTGNCSYKSFLKTGLVPRCIVNDANPQ